MKQFRKLRRTLARERPTELPTRVYLRTFKPGDPTHGYTFDRVRDGKQIGWHIEIRKGMSEHIACETLCEEWAHARRGIPDPPADPHDDAFWIEHGRCRALYYAMLDG